MNFEQLQKMGMDAGFSHVVPLNPTTIELKQEVRDMCAANGCGQYGKRWSCPPGCGELEELRRQVSGYTQGILVQTVGELEDELDGEGMMDAEAAHKEHFHTLWEEIRRQYPHALAIGSGCCTKCKVCTYPEEPCRFPDARISSMEAYGMLVLQVCKDNDLKYYYGKNTIAYTGCFLID